MPFLLQFEEDEKIEPLTTAWALSSGWMWMIPTQERYGCGYVFDDRFISHEEAQKEVETKLGKQIEPIRFLKFDTGRLDSFWNKNCLSVGLSAAFAEPLEATSIHSTILQLNSFIFDYLKDTKEQTLNSGMINIYNRRISKMYDNYAQFEYAFKYEVWKIIVNFLFFKQVKKHLHEVHIYDGYKHPADF
jgi:tryptophan halogenase